MDYGSFWKLNGRPMAMELIFFIIFVVWKNGCCSLAGKLRRGALICFSVIIN